MMVQDMSKNRNEHEHEHQGSVGRDGLFHLSLWSLWLLSIAAGGFLYWRDAITTQQAADPIGLVMRMVLIGTVGLIVKTVVELRLNPENYID